MRLEVAVELTIPDNTAFTVLSALRQLGYGGLRSVVRADVLCLTLGEDAALAADVVDRLSEAEVVVNPNKHRLSYSVLEAVPDEQASCPEREHEALVSYREDDATKLGRLLSGCFGIRGLQHLQRAVAWRLSDGEGPAAVHRLKWACESLLCNPLSQRSMIRMRPLRLAHSRVHNANNVDKGGSA